MLWLACVHNSPIFHTDSELKHSWFTGKEVEMYTGAEEAVQVHIASRPGLCAFKLRLWSPCPEPLLSDAWLINQCGILFIAVPSCKSFQLCDPALIPAPSGLRSQEEQQLTPPTAEPSMIHVKAPDYLQGCPGEEGWVAEVGVGWSRGWSYAQGVTLFVCLNMETQPLKTSVA